MKANETDERQTVQPQTGWWPCIFDLILRGEMPDGKMDFPWPAAGRQEKTCRDQVVVVAKRGSLLSRDL